VDAAEGTVCQVVVPGDAGGAWQVARREGAWVLDVAVPLARAAVVSSTTSLPGDIAWRVFTKGITRDEARSRISIEGDERLGLVVLRALAIVG
jgi:hypothetical protein